VVEHHGERDVTGEPREDRVGALCEFAAVGHLHSAPDDVPAECIELILPLVLREIRAGQHGRNGGGGEQLRPVRAADCVEEARQINRIGNPPSMRVEGAAVE
jgi:hypothetical protein